MFGKRYKAIVFDWDGTAVASRTAPTDLIIPRMCELLLSGVVLVVISGTTYENIAGGRLHDLLPAKALDRLFLGLGRGAFEYSFSKEGTPVILSNRIPDAPTLLRIHDWAYAIHRMLLERYAYPTDVVFSRPNYCKVDLLVSHDRGSNLYFQSGELDQVNDLLSLHGYAGGIRALIDECTQMGREFDLNSQVTTDAKYLEVGVSTKSNNVDSLLRDVLLPRGILPQDCCFWGDEFTYLGEGVKGSDAHMLTPASKYADFFDVSDHPLELPPEVHSVGGGVSTFLQFLKHQHEAN